MADEGKRKNNVGRPKKPPGEKAVDFTSTISPADLERLDRIRLNHGFPSRRQLMEYFIRLEDAITGGGLSGEAFTEVFGPITSERDAAAAGPDTVSSKDKNDKLAFEVKSMLTTSVWQRYAGFFQVRNRQWAGLSNGEKLEKLLDLAEAADDQSNSNNRLAESSETGPVLVGPFKLMTTPSLGPVLVSDPFQLMTPPSPKRRKTMVPIKVDTSEPSRGSVGSLNEAVVRNMNARFRSGMKESNDGVPPTSTKTIVSDDSQLTTVLTSQIKVQSTPEKRVMVESTRKGTPELGRNSITSGPNNARVSKILWHEIGEGVWASYGEVESSSTKPARNDDLSIASCQPIEKSVNEEVIDKVTPPGDMRSQVLTKNDALATATSDYTQPIISSELYPPIISPQPIISSEENITSEPTGTILPEVPTHQPSSLQEEYPPHDGAGSIASCEKSTSNKVKALPRARYRLSFTRASKSILERCKKFFERHGFEMESNTEKLNLLLDLAESHQDLIRSRGEPAAGTRNQNPQKMKMSWKTSNGKAQLEEFDEDSDGSWNDGTKPKKEKIQVTAHHAAETNGKQELKICMPLPLRQRYKKFFATIGWDKKCKVDQIILLIRLAESHPDLVNGDRTELTALDLEELRANALDLVSPEEIKARFQVTLPLAWHKNFMAFFEKRGWESKSSTQKINILLDLAESHPVFFEGAEINRPVFDKLKFPTASVEEIEKEKADARKIDSDLQASKAQDVPMSLLAPDYYMKFSREARSKRPAGFARTYAAMANTRRHIVEWHQLKQLIAQCSCLDIDCQQLIDSKSIKIKEIGCALEVTAHCCSSAKHKFTWASSAKLKHETKAHASVYVLNVVVPVAIPISGNNSTKMDHFAKVIRLSWTDKNSHERLIKPCCMPIVKKCFEMTQDEMLTKLKEENSGQLVLAGDGQFDSPGACANMCTYTLMALGVEENRKDSEKLKRCGYVISQVVIDRRHADNKSTNMERIGLHWALQPVIKAKIKVAELVTDEHVQVVSDFKKIRAAAEERAANEDDDDDQDRALTVFKNSLSTALIHAQPPVDVEKDALDLLSFYSAIVSSNDIWHKAKNLLKSVSSIAQTAASKEQQCYRRYAKMLRNYLWECAEGAQGDADKFIDLWTTVERHLNGDHKGCTKVDLHSKTKLMDKLDQTTRSFTKLLACINRVTDAAQQLCRFRNTGILEAYNGLTLKYCPKRIGLPYDSMTMRKELAALDHNHHILRSYRKTQDGRLVVGNRFRKSTKGYSLAFRKEEKNYAYLGHLMAAILLYRCQTDHDFRDCSSIKSAAHPSRIQRSIAPHEQTLKVTCAQWISRKKENQRRIAAANTKVAEKKSSGRKRKATTLSSSSSESDSEADDSRKSGSEKVFKK